MIYRPFKGRKPLPGHGFSPVLITAEPATSSFEQRAAPYQDMKPSELRAISVEQRLRLPNADELIARARGRRR